MEDFSKYDSKFQYMMLDRMRQDCEYFLNYGTRNEKSLWAQEVSLQIKYMKQLYNLVPEKPEWLSLEKIEEYEFLMSLKEGDEVVFVNKEQKCFGIEKVKEIKPINDWRYPMSGVLTENADQAGYGEVIENFRTTGKRNKEEVFCSKEQELKDLSLCELCRKKGENYV